MKFLNNDKWQLFVFALLIGASSFFVANLLGDVFYMVFKSEVDFWAAKKAILNFDVFVFFAVTILVFWKFLHDKAAKQKARYGK